MSDQFLVCDLSVRSQVSFALAESGRPLGLTQKYACASSSEFEQCVTACLRENGNPGVKGVALASRGWEVNGVVQSVEGDLCISRHEVRAILGIQRVNIVNNFVARALAMPGLRRTERAKISGVEGSGGENVIAVLGPHYGLGAASLVSDGGGGWTALPGEGGHSDLAAKSDREWEIISALVAALGYASRETALSLQGVANIWHALHALDGKACQNLSPVEIIEKSKSGDPLAMEAMRMIAVWLGAFASDLALIMGARGGIYLTGALIDLMGDNFDTKAFLDRFVDKGPRQGYVSEIPVYRTLASDLELRGLATLFD